jgi:hypothetical protein
MYAERSVMNVPLLRSGLALMMVVFLAKNEIDVVIRHNDITLLASEGDGTWTSPRHGKATPLNPKPEHG